MAPPRLLLPVPMIVRVIQNLLMATLRWKTARRKEAVAPCPLRVLPSLSGRYHHPSFLMSAMMSLLTIRGTVGSLVQS